MNRYRTGGPSKATPTTLCQKCLKKGHYTYECTATQQERPYTSRPSRSQQLLNPKLAPKLSATLPPVDAKPAAKPESKLEDKTRTAKISILLFIGLGLLVFHGQITLEVSVCWSRLELTPEG
ncbi:hypothetical protein CERZMDRAFT_99395 [Cercospora zeae-maydis SCOH1-5]|uniref:CCHC-type domain-containing protein n=1 Tax=Cercospora zeae-maydis SCOH1-5 TaxID=717836 RepID=A0A6A6FA79_9PEZI|nr:hypothetical protein CERZMDRAFT_99395 [Cercospora zeae-maydis SCOH1-5]